jgi:hypothetical protein
MLHACSTLLDAAELERFNITRVDDRLYQTTPLSKLYPNVTGPGQQEVLIRSAYTYTTVYIHTHTITNVLTYEGTVFKYRIALCRYHSTCVCAYMRSYASMCLERLV